MGTGAVWVIPIAMVLDINALGVSKGPPQSLGTRLGPPCEYLYVLMVTNRVDMACMYICSALNTI